MPGGMAGKTYPGSFDCEIEKNKTITAIQITRKELSVSESGWRNRRIAQIKAAITNTAHGTQPSSVTGPKYSCV